MRLFTALLLLANCHCAVAGELNPTRIFRHKSEVVSVTFSPDGGFLVAGAGVGSFIFWDPNTGSEIRRIEIRRIEGDHVGDAMAFSPDGTILATTRNWKYGPAGGVVHLWDVATGKRNRQILGDDGAKNLTRCVAFSPDGKLLAAQPENNFECFKRTSGKQHGKTAISERMCLRSPYLLTGKALHRAVGTELSKFGNLPTFLQPRARQ